jgi:hypothetical protein
MPAPRFGIGEWFGKPFANLSVADRKRLAAIALTSSLSDYPPCPFQVESKRCNKKGGICSLRLYNAEPGGLASVLTGADGELRIVCPERFDQANLIFREIGQRLLGTPNPLIVSEVRFLQRTDPNVASEPDSEAGREDVGNIDNVLVHPTARPLRWCAVEIQAVYFSGTKMEALFKHVRDFGQGLPFPDKTRRPDYRSSGPKRLMPQLQIKVPTLRRWGKKMAVVVDRAWFRTNVIGVPTVADLSNCDIAWFTVGFDERTNPATLIVDEPQKQTLERAIEGLTGGFPVSLSEFERRIKEKIQG